MKEGFAKVHWKSTYTYESKAEYKERLRREYQNLQLGRIKKAMTKIEINTFIEVMEELNDKWEPEDVKRVFGEMSLNDAIATRRSELSLFLNILSTVSNK